MKKATKLKICNWLLLIATPIILVSSIQLEATSSRSIPLVWFHVVAGSVFVTLATWHIALNLKWGNWFAKFRRVKSPVTRALWWLSLLTVVSAVIAFVHWIGTYEHSPLGGLHGKIGFVMIAIAIGHTIKRFKYFRPRPSR